MTKSEVKELFGGTVNLCAELGISERSWYRWPNPITREQRDQVIGALVRMRHEETGDDVLVKCPPAPEEYDGVVVAPPR